MHLISAGMYRSCSTWQFMIAAELLERTSRCERLGHIDFHQMLAMGREASADRAGWSILKTHEGNGLIRGCLQRRVALALYSYRDVRDVVFSLAYKFALPFETMLRRGMYHQVLRNDRFWRRQPGTLIQRYEEMTAHPERAIQQIAQHLGLGISDAEIKRLADEFSIEKNKARTAAVAARLLQRGADLQARQFAIADDRHTLLHWNHIRQGRIGGWRDQATPEQIQHIARLFGDWLIEHGYEPDRHWVDQACDAAAARLQHSPAPGTTTPAVPPLRTRDHWRGYACCRLRMLAFEHPRLRVLGRRLLESTPFTRPLLAQYRAATRLADSPPIREDLSASQRSQDSSVEQPDAQSIAA